MTPFDFWTGMWRSGQAMADAGMKMAQMADASRTVIETRSQAMLAASRDPLNGDYAELSRMVPEKVAAFARAGASAVDDLQAVQAQAIANWQMMMGIALKGRAATPAEVGTMTSRTATIIERSAKAAGRALAPVHRNARRLTRAKARKKV
ncbi:MAG: hypothetical protein VW891_02645 [Novosphingobium sp.]